MLGKRRLGTKSEVADQVSKGRLILGKRRFFSREPNSLSQVSSPHYATREIEILAVMEQRRNQNDTDFWIHP